MNPSQLPNFEDPVVRAALEALAEKAKWLTLMAVEGKGLEHAAVIDLAAFLTTAAGLVFDSPQPPAMRSSSPSPPRLRLVSSTD